MGYSSPANVVPITVGSVTGERELVVEGDYAEWLYGIGLATKTVRIYSYCIERWVAWCLDEKVNPARPTPLQVSMYAQGLPQTSSARRQHRAALRHWFDLCGHPEPPMRAIRVPPKKRYMARPLEPAEAAVLFRTARGWHPEGTAVLCGLLLALRSFETAKLRWDDFDGNGEWVKIVGKRDVEATLPVHTALRDQLAEHRTWHPYVFTGRTQAHVASRTVGTWVGRVSEKAGIGKVESHRLRHTAISAINDATRDLRAAQEFARHASPETTMIYTRVTKDRLVSAMESLTYAA